MTPLRKAYTELQQHQKVFNGQLAKIFPIGTIVHFKRGKQIRSGVVSMHDQHSLWIKNEKTGTEQAIDAYNVMTTEEEIQASN